MADSAYNDCCAILENVEGKIPVAWHCWKIELEIAKGNWDTADEAASYVPCVLVALLAFS